jgi:N,N-dimethylformamidase
MATEKAKFEKSGQRADASRRDFLRGSAATVLGASVVCSGEAVAAQPLEKGQSSPDPNPLPQHKAVRLPGVHGYAEKSLAAGERLHLRISADVEYRLSMRRLGPRVDDRDSDEIVHRFAVAEPRVQPIHPGSYIHFAKGLDADRALDTLTLECWLRPWVLNRRQGIITQLDNADGPGIGLLLTSQSELAFHCGVDRDSGKPCVLTSQVPAGRTWRHFVATWDGKTARLFLDGKPAAEAKFNAVVKPHKGPLRLGASGSNGTAVEFLDGDLAAPAIYSAALTDDAVAARYDAQGLTQAAADSLVAYWPLDEERGATIRDATGHGHDGLIINRGTWMIGGPSFDGAKVPRFGNYDPNADPKRGHGLRLASDDLYDCRWEVTQTFDVPADAKPGLYTAEAEFEREGKPYRYPITFVVRRSKTQPAADILVLAATSTWTAYSGTPFAVNTNGPQSWGTGGIKNSHEEAPWYCCYRNHRHGQPTYQIGLNLPWPVAGPEVLYSPQQVGYSHLARADRFLMAWLETEGVNFDVCSDHDLHRWPQLLDERKIVFINGHSEYWSREACEATDAYLRRGGSLIVLSGNTMLWRTSFDDEVMECRKFDDRIGGRQFATIGELYHTHDHRRGSMLRECGSPSWKVIGLEADGWNNTGAITEFLPYHVTDAEHPLFTTPTPTNLHNGDTFGAAEGHGPRAVGHEWDVRVPRIVAMTKANEGATLPAEPAGIQTLAVGKRDTGVALDYLGYHCKFVDGICAEFIDWKRPEGGRVINFGSIGVGWALAGDPKLQTILRNAMHACGVSPPARKNA